MGTSSAGTHRTVTINRAPVLTLWAAVVAERLGYDRDEAVTLGRAVAGLNAASKARALGIARASGKPAAEKQAAEKRAAKAGTPDAVELCGRMVPVVHTPEGLRATSDGRPTSPSSVHQYLTKNFGDALDDARAAMAALARSLDRHELAGTAFSLYEAFRPSVPRGTKGWGAKGVLDLARIRDLAARGRGRG
jgi:hypothetical protein